METLKIILDIMAEKKAGKIVPAHALMREVILRRPEAKEELILMQAEGMIQIGPTINSSYIKIL
jgi:hypothetical protein